VRDPLSFPQSESIAYRLRDVYRAFAQILENELERHDVNIGSWLYLRVLWDEDGLTQSELTRRVGLMQPNTNAALRQLERRGLIRQTVDPHDRRRINIFLTPEGRALSRVLIPAAKKIRTRSVAGFRASEVAKLIEMLERMKANLTDASAAPARRQAARKNANGSTKVAGRRAGSASRPGGGT
jgi:DNA-binding MarR family transcriptional regulator